MSWGDCIREMWCFFRDAFSLPFPSLSPGDCDGHLAVGSVRADGKVVRFNVLLQHRRLHLQTAEGKGWESGKRSNGRGMSQRLHVCEARCGCVRQAEGLFYPTWARNPHGLNVAHLAKIHQDVLRVLFIPAKWRKRRNNVRDEWLGGLQRQLRRVFPLTPHRCC